MAATRRPGPGRLPERVPYGRAGARCVPSHPCWTGGHTDDSIALLQQELGKIEPSWPVIPVMRAVFMFRSIRSLLAPVAGLEQHDIDDLPARDYPSILPSRLPPTVDRPRTQQRWGDHATVTRESQHSISDQLPATTGVGRYMVSIATAAAELPKSRSAPTRVAATSLFLPQSR